MPEPRPPVTPPPLHKDANTGEWSDVTARESPAPADTPTVTTTGQALPPSNLGISNPFGRYRIDRLLGRGGMATVYLALDTQLQRPVALKIPSFGSTPTSGQKERFFREARAVSALHHANICQVFDVDEEQGVLYLTTAFIDGEPLASRIERGPMSPDKAVELVRCVARAMQAAHAHGTIHRDLKPANIMIDRANQPVIMDFGLARRTDSTEDLRESRHFGTTGDQGLTQHGSVLGTPAYMSPEQARGDIASVGPASDVYSLGIILFELITGRRPFVAGDTSQLIEKILTAPAPKISDYHPWIDPKVEAACLKALEKDPNARHPTMAGFERALKDAVDPEFKVVLPPPLPPKAGNVRKKRRWMSPLGCLAITTGFMLVCVGGPTLAIWFIIDQTAGLITRIGEKQYGEMQQQAKVEWETINALWVPPPAEVHVEVLFPPTIAGGFERSRVDSDVADVEFGLTLPGRRAFYSGPNSDEVEVRAYRCPEPEAKSIQEKVEAYVMSVKNGSATRKTTSNRQKVNLTATNPDLKTLTFGFSDTFNRNQELGKIWYGKDWLFYFRSNSVSAIETFSTKYLQEIISGQNAEKKVEPKKKKK